MATRTSFLLLIVGTLIAHACKKDKDDAPSGTGSGALEAARVQFNIDGDGFSGQAITINPASGSGNALYSTADDETSGSIIADAQNQFTVLFDGNTTATLTCSGGAGPVGIGLRTGGQQYVYQDNTVIITEYGTVGGWIRGTFSGTMLRANGASAGTPVSITNGSFRFKRLNDV